MKVIFLDVDGVLNHQDVNHKITHKMQAIEDEKLVLLKELVDATDANIVLSSSWRSGWSLLPGEDKKKRTSLDSSESFFILCALLREHNLSIFSETPRIDNASREDLIDYWLEHWGGDKISNYVILDDEPRMFSESNQHLVTTSPYAGLQRADVEKAIEILKS